MLTSPSSSARYPDPAARGHVGRGARLTLIGQLIRTACNLAGLLILARLLSPRDYGLVAMVTVIMGLGEVLRDMGLSTAAVQAPNLTDRQRSNLFWMSASVGLIFCLGILLLAPTVAAMYGEPSIMPIASFLSATFLLNGLSAQHRANANREMKFGRLVVIDTAPPVLGLCIAVAMAFSGSGAWSLVAQQLATAACGMLLSWVLMPWLPTMPSRSAGMLGFVKFGVPLVGAQILGYVSRSIDTAVMGIRFGSAAAGIYDRAFQIVMLPINQFAAPSTRVALPALARKHGSPEEMGRSLRQGQAALVYPVACLLMLVLAVSPSAIPVVLGDHWNGAVPFVQVLAVGALAQTLSYSSYWAFLSYGRTGANLAYSLASRPIVICAILAGSMFGPIWIAVGYSTGLVLIWPLAFYWIRNFPGIDSLGLLRDGASAVLTYAPAALASAALSWALTTADVDVRWVLVAGILAFALISTLMVLVLPPARNALSLVVRHFIRS